MQTFNCGHIHRFYKTAFLFYINQRIHSTASGCITPHFFHLNSSACSVCLAAVVNFDNRHSPCGWPWVNGPLSPPCLMHVICSPSVPFCLFFHCCPSKRNPHLVSNQGPTSRQGGENTCVCCC